ncbi:Pentatricopeptide repeat-containing protein [Apostasia shenzhenica]|uniref:Pentatricopeptide repeat-containing protein n=1 Tax=Apostasia shenzhenica TaxID=1088818 RepID=A0A2I0AC88_9ASPA|nr:Pentatricopeptide repeat-containing protein [Apostasia shenzhenica]
MLSRVRRARTGLRRSCPRKSPQRRTPPEKEPIPALQELKSVAAGDPTAALCRLLSSSDPALHDYPACSSLLYRLARARLFPELEALLLFVRSRRIPCKDSLFSALIRHFSRASLPDKALGLFLSIPSFNCPPGSPSTQTFNHLLDSLVDNGRHDEAESLFSRSSDFGLRRNHVSYNVILKGRLQRLGKDDGFAYARQLFDEMRKRGIGPSVVSYNLLIGFLTKNNNLSKAMDLKEKMIREGTYPNAVTYAILMKGLCSSDNYAAAKKLMFDMEYNGCKTKLVNYGVLMSDCRRRGDMEEMRKLFAEMRIRRMKPDDVIYSILINSFCTNGGVRDAYKVFVEMQVKGKFRPNAAIYRMMVDGFCKAGEFEKGLGVLNAMLASGHYPRVKTFECLISWLFEGGRVREICFLFEEMEKMKKGLALDVWHSLVKTVCLKCDDFADLLCELTSMAFVEDEENTFHHLHPP